MIPVQPQPEPNGFDAAVRVCGNNWMAARNISTNGPLPRGTHLEDFWTTCLEDLHTVYGGVCAYLCIYLEYESGSVTVDHFLPKSQYPGLAYEWVNFRLASRKMNGRKWEHMDVIDPFTIQHDMFHLTPVTFNVFPNPQLAVGDRVRVQATINRLRLDNPYCRKMRQKHWQIYQENHDAGFLQWYSPFVWYEMKRQGLL